MSGSASSGANETMPDGMQVFERGWLSSNSILFADANGATLIDSGYVTPANIAAALAQHVNDNVTAIVIEIC